MSIAIPVSQKFKVGDHVGLPEIMAVGNVIERRGLLPGADYDGKGRYLVEFDGVPEAVHLELLVSFRCRCRAHEAMLAKMSRRKFNRERDMPGAIAELGRSCASQYLPEKGKSRIWLTGRDVVNCTGKRRLPLGVNVYEKLTYVDLAPMGTWDPKA